MWVLWCGGRFVGRDEEVRMLAGVGEAGGVSTGLESAVVEEEGPR